MHVLGVHFSFHRVFCRLSKTHRVCCQRLIVGVQIMMDVKENSKHFDRAPNNHRVQQV